MPDANDRAIERAEAGSRRPSSAFLSAYMAGIAGSGILPEDEAAARELIDFFVMQKTVYEIGYELANRPGWIDIPLDGALALLAGPAAD